MAQPSATPPRPPQKPAGASTWERIRRRVDDALRQLLPQPEPEPELIPIPVRRR
jgi:hypothetical protein